MKKILLVALVGLAIVAGGVVLSAKQIDNNKDSALGETFVPYGTKPGG